ncbi:MAG: Lrp/AsnC family transcriptional regulator [Sulfuriflexus sp.]|nr:Lrp/AsnC family transcriptional regulator [Sulfuriflexus sp.]
MDNLDRLIINTLQDGFPICDNPYAVVAQDIGTNENELIQRIDSLLDEGLLSRFGPMFNADKMGGAFTLCAMTVPKEHFEQIANYVNSFDEVAHNYEREHTLNMWFVVGTEKPEQIDAVLDSIQSHTGLVVHNMPKQEEFFIKLKFNV